MLSAEEVLQIELNTLLLGTLFGPSLSRQHFNRQEDALRLDNRFLFIQSILQIPT